MEDRQYLADKMSDAELGRRVGMSRQQIGAIKKGQSGTKADVVRAIATALGAKPDEALQVWVSGDEADMRADVEITRIVYSLKPEQRPALLRAVRSMAEALSL
jgi:transcriptional regulator with XRE-family HTH domain